MGENTRYYLSKYFDGDCVATYYPHSEDSLKECYENAFYRNVVHYDASNACIATIRHEALYMAYVLTSEKMDNSAEILYKGKLKKLPESFELINNHLTSPVIIDSEKVTYGVALLNKWLETDKILVRNPITKKEIGWLSELIFSEIANRDSTRYYDIIYNLEKKLFFISGCTNYTPTIDLPSMNNMVQPKERALFNKMPKHNAYVTYHINLALVDRCIENCNHDSQLYKLFKSGSRFSKSQLSRSCINLGLVADNLNIVDPTPINSSLIVGLTPDEFFQGSPGTRKGIVDKDNATPESGYLTRTMVMALGIIEFAEDDCGCTTGLNIKVLNEQHLGSIVGKYYKLKQDDPEWLLINKNDKHLIGQEIVLRSTMTCKTPNFKICRKCFGTKNTRTPYIGIPAAHSVTERLTQLTLRSFHESGSCSLDTNKSFIDLIKNHLIDIENLAEETYILHFNTAEFDESIKKIPGFIKFQDSTILFNPIKDKVVNNDAIATLNTVKRILHKDPVVSKPPSSYYTQLIDALLSVGNIYSSYIEMMLMHMFLVDDDNNQFWRYNQDKPITIKLGSTTMANKISPLLGFLYQPNKMTIGNINMDDSNINLLNELNVDNLSIHEKLFLQQF